MSDYIPTADEQAILDYLQKCVDSAQLYVEVYDNYEALKEAEVLPDVIQMIKGGAHRGEYQTHWYIEPEDLEEYENDQM
jgi:hypothetical protein